MTTTLSPIEEDVLYHRYKRLPESLQQKIEFKTILKSIAEWNIDPVIEVFYTYQTDERYSEIVEAFIGRMYFIQHDRQDPKDYLPWGSEKNLDTLKAHEKLVADITDEIMTQLENRLTVMEQGNKKKQ